MEFAYIFYIIFGVLCVECPCTFARIFIQDVKVYYGNFTGFHNDFNKHKYAGFQTLMPSFGFLKDGRIHASLQCRERDAPVELQCWFLLCATADTKAMYRKSSTEMDLEYKHLARELPDQQGHDSSCVRDKLTRTQSSVEAQYTYSRTVEQRAFYSLLLLQAPSHPHPPANSSAWLSADPVHCRSHVTAVNAGGKQLSSDELPLPVLYTVLTMVWALLVTTWFFNAVLYYQYSNRLHRLIVTVPIIKVLQVLLSLLWWQHVANTGLVSSELNNLCSAMTCMHTTVLFVLIMLIAEGWGVVRCRLKHSTGTSFILCFVIFMTSLFCVHWLHRFFMAFSICCVVVMMFKTLKWTALNIEHLRRCRRKMRRFMQRQNLRYCGAVTVDMQLCEKLLLFRRFRGACVTFSLMYSVAITLSTFVQEHAYVRALLLELPELVIYIVLGVLFRLRNFERYNNIELFSPKEDVALLELPEVGYGYTDPHFVLGRPISFKVEKETQTPRRRWGRSL